MGAILLTECTLALVLNVVPTESVQMTLQYLAIHTFVLAVTIWPYFQQESGVHRGTKL